MQYDAKKKKLWISFEFNVLARILPIEKKCSLKMPKRHILGKALWKHCAKFQIFRCVEHNSCKCMASERRNCISICVSRDFPRTPATIIQYWSVRSYLLSFKYFITLGVIPAGLLKLVHWLLDLQACLVEFGLAALAQTEKNCMRDFQRSFVFVFTKKRY